MKKQKEEGKYILASFIGKVSMRKKVKIYAVATTLNFNYGKLFYLVKKNAKENLVVYV